MNVQTHYEKERGDELSFYSVENLEVGHVVYLKTPLLVYGWAVVTEKNGNNYKAVVK